MSLRVIALVDGQEISRWRARCIDALLAIPDVHVSLAAAGGVAARLPAEGLAARLSGSADLRRVTLSGVRAVPKGGDGAHPDLIVDLRETPGMERLMASRFGTVALIAGSRRGVPFFAQAASGAPTAEAELRLIDGSGEARTLRWGRFTLAYGYAKALHAYAQTACLWLDALVGALQRGEEPMPLRAADPVAAVEPVRLRELPAFAWGCAARFLAFAWEFFFVDVCWDVGVAQAQPADLIEKGSLGRIAWLHAGQRRPFFADPFYLRRGELEYVLCEAMPDGTRTGVVQVLAFTREPRVTSARTVLANGSHLSYPFVLEVDGVAYAIPENSAAGHVAAYEIAGDGAWSYHATLMEDVDACDSTIVRYDGAWWLFCTRRGAGSNLHLYVYRADHPFGPWSPHRANPVKTDVRSARPAGAIFEHEGTLYRPGQDCGDVYGGAVVVHRITRLDEFAYEEAPVCSLRPAAPYAKGLHTLTFAPGIALVDGRRDHLSIGKAFWQSGRLVRRLVRRFTSHPQPPGNRPAPAGQVSV